MVQILEDEPSFASQIAGRLIPGAANFAKGLQEQRNTAKLNSELKRMTGMDLSALSPEAKAKVVEQLSKTSGKQRLLNEAFPGKFGSNSNQQMGSKLQGLPTESQQEAQPAQEGFDISKFTPEDRVKMALVDPNVAKQLTKEEDLQFKKNVHEQGLIDKSYEAHKDFIDSTTNAFKGFETETKPRLLQMQKLADEQLIGPGATKFLEAAGVPLGVLENPSNEVYSKLSQDLLKGLPDTYGNRILKVEVENFLKTIPTLLNSPEGRRMIASNMLKLGQMKEVFYKEMRRQQMDNLDTNKKFPKDFEQRVFDNVLPHVNKLNNQFIKLSEIKSIPPDTVPFFGPTGEVFFVPKNAEALEWATTHDGEQIW